MSLSRTYAQVIQGAPDSGTATFAKKLVAYMKSKGHLSLLPEIVRILEREPKRAEATVVVAREHDAKKFAHSITEALKLLGVEEKPEVIADPRLVGGYAVRAKGK